MQLLSRTEPLKILALPRKWIRATLRQRAVNRQCNREGRKQPQRFLRIHPSAIVNLSKVKECQPRGNGEVVVVRHNEMQLKLSRRRRKELEAGLKSMQR